MRLTADVREHSDANSIAWAMLSQGDCFAFSTHLRLMFYRATKSSTFQKSCVTPAAIAGVIRKLAWRRTKL